MCSEKEGDETIIVANILPTIMIDIMQLYSGNEFFHKTVLVIIMLKNNIHVML